MKESINFNKNFIVSLILLCAVILCVLCINDIDMTNIASATNSEAPNIEELCEDYTDSDIIQGTGQTIRDYPTELALSTISSEYDTEVYSDDPIVKIIPRQYFVERGEHFYIGKEYGFFVSTKEMNANCASNLIIAFVFDISSMRDMEQTQNRVIVKVQPLFQYYYAYLTQTDNYYIVPQTSAYVYWGGISQDGNVIPLVLSESEALPSTEFYLKDVSFSMTLYNEQELNTYNAEYQPEHDDGSFITQYDYFYEGINRTSEGFDVTPHDVVSYVTTGVDIICSVVGTFVPVPGVDLAMEVLGALSSIVDDLNLITDIVEKSNQTGPVDVELSNGKITATCLYTTRRDQLAHYVDAETQRPALTKSATILIKGDDNTGNVWYKVGNSAEGYFTLSDSADTTPWYTRYIQEIALSVVDKDGNEHISQAVGSQTYMLYEPIYKPGRVGANEVSFLPQGKQYVSFNPQFTSDYEITFDKSYEFGVAVVDRQTNQRTIISPVEGKYKYRFVGGKTYNVEIYSPYGDVVNMSIEPSDTTVSQSFDANGQNVFKYVSAENQIVTLSSSNRDVKPVGVYQQNSNGLTYLPEIAGLKDCTSVEMYMQAGKTYYVVLENTLYERAEASLHVEEKANAELMTDMAISFDDSANYKYFSFNPSQNGDYYIAFENSELSQDTDYNMHFYCFDQDRREISYTGYGVGYLVLLGLEEGKTYYIAISSSNATTVTSNIKREKAKFAWKMKVNDAFEEIENIVYVKRGNTYEFGLWVDGVKARNYDYKIAVEEQEYFKPDSNKPGVVTILNNTPDAMHIYITALIDEQILAEYTYELLIYAVYDESKVTVDINYENTTEVVLHDQNGTSEIKKWTGTIYLDSETIAVNNENNIYKEILVKRKVWHWFRFTLNSITISSLYGDKEINGLSVSCTVYTMYSKTSLENGKTVYHIANALQFYNIRKDQRYKRVMDNNISLKDFSNWDPISSQTCDLDGNGHAITDLSIILDAPYINKRYGLVDTNRAVISNLTLENYVMSYGWEEKDSWMYVGAFAGVNFGTIQNCSAYGSIYGYREFMSVGGIVGQNQSGGEILNTVYGRPVGNPTSVVYSWGELGGIAGQNYGKIQHTRVLNTKIQHRVYGSARSIGGIAGYAENCQILNCAVEDSVIENINDQTIKSFYPKMGVIVGHMVNGTITSVGARNVRTSTGKLYKDNTKYCFNGGWPFYGRMEDCIVDGNHGQYGP